MNNSLSQEWIDKFMDLAKKYSEWSKDPSTKIGCIAIDPQTKNVLSSGYNGFPRGIKDSEKRLNDREEKYKYMAHAEKNCIYNACLNGVSLKDSIFFVYNLPTCSECAKGIIQVGAAGVYYHFEESDQDFKEKWMKWIESGSVSSKMFKEAGLFFKKAFH